LNAIEQHDGPKISNFVTYGLKWIWRTIVRLNWKEK
jgi:hypothetical protein